MSILSFILYLLVAAVCVYLGKKFVPNTVPGGMVTSAVVGVIGAWIGGTMIGSYGPDLFGVSLIPSILGSGILIFALSYVSGTLPKSS